MTASLPIITAELRNSFLPLLHTLEDENTFASYTYVIELLFSLVRMDASLRIEERDVFLRAFNFLANAQLTKLRQTKEQQEHMTRLKQHLSIILFKCEILRAICNEKKLYNESKLENQNNDDNKNVEEAANESLDTDNETDINDTTMPFVEVANDNLLREQSNSPNKSMKTNTVINRETRKKRFASSTFSSSSLSSLERYNEQEEETQAAWKENITHMHDVHEIRTRLRYYFDKYLASTLSPSAAPPPPLQTKVITTINSITLPNTSLSLISETENVYSPTHPEEVSPLLTSNSSSSVSLNRSPLNAYDQTTSDTIDDNKNNAEQQADELTKRKEEFKRFENAFWQFIGSEHVSSEKDYERNSKVNTQNSYPANTTTANKTSCTSADVCVLLALFNCNSVRRFNDAVQRAAKNKNYPFASLDPRNMMSANVTLSNSSSLGYLDHINNASLHHYSIHSNSHSQMHPLHYAKTMPNLLALQQIDHKQWVKSSRFVHELVVSTMQLPIDALHDDFWQTTQIYMLVLISYLLDVELPGTEPKANNEVKKEQQQREKEHKSHYWNEKEMEMFKFICPSLRLYTTSSANYLTLATPVLSSMHSLRSALANEAKYTNTPNSQVTTAEVTPNLSMTSSTVYFSNNNISTVGNTQPHMITSADSISSNMSSTPSPAHLLNSSSQMQSSFYATALTPMRFADELKLIQSRISTPGSVSLNSIDVILHALLASLLCTIKSSSNNKSKAANIKYSDSHANDENHLEESSVKIDKPAWNAESDDTHSSVHMPSMLRAAHTQENLNQNNISSSCVDSERLTVPLHKASTVSSKLNSTSNMTASSVSGEELHGAGLANYSFNSTCTYVTNNNNNNNNDYNNTTNNNENDHSIGRSSVNDGSICYALDSKTNAQLELSINDLCSVYKDVMEAVRLEEHEEEELHAEQLTEHNKIGGDNTNKVNSNEDNLTNTHIHFHLPHQFQTMQEQERMTTQSNKYESNVADYLCSIIHQWLKQAEDSIITLEQVASQTRGEMTLLIFRVVSSLLDWVIPAAYAADGRLTMFYRKWVCDCYRLLYEEQLLELFEKLLDQNVDKIADITITNEHEVHYINVNDKDDHSTSAHSPRHIHNNHHQYQQHHQDEYQKERQQQETSEAEYSRGDNSEETKREEISREGEVQHNNEINNTRSHINKERDMSASDKMQHETLEGSSVQKKHEYKQQREHEHYTQYPEKDKVEPNNKINTTNTVNNANALVDHSGPRSSYNYNSGKMNFCAPGRGENAEPVSFSVPHSPTLSAYSNISHTLHDPLALVVPGGGVEIIYHARVPHYNSRDTMQTSFSPWTQYHAESIASASYPHAFPCHPANVFLSSPSEHRYPAHYPVNENHNPLCQENNNNYNYCYHHNTQHPCYNHNTHNTGYSTISFNSNNYYNNYGGYTHYSTNNFALHVACMLLDQGAQVYSPCHFLLTRFIIAMIRNMNEDATRSLLRIFDAPLPHHSLQHENEIIDDNNIFSPITTSSSSPLHHHSTRNVPRIASRVYMSNTIMPTSTSSLTSSSSLSSKIITSTHHNVHSSPSSPTYPTTGQHDTMNITFSPNVWQPPERHSTFTTTNTSRPHRQPPSNFLINKEEHHEEQHALNRPGMRRSYSHYAQSPLQSTLVNNYTFMNNSSNSVQPYNVLPAQSFPASPLAEYRPYSPHELHDTLHETQEPSHELQRVFLSPHSTYAANSPTTRMYDSNGERPVLLHHHRFRYPIVNSVHDLIALYIHTLDDASLLLSPHDPIRASLMLNMMDCLVHHNKTIKPNNDSGDNNDLESGLELLSNYLNDVREECVDEMFEVIANLPASMQANACASTTTNIKSNSHSNVNSSYSKGQDGKNTSSEVWKNGNMTKSQRGKEINENKAEDFTTEDEGDDTDKNEVNTKVSNADLTNNNADDSVMLTIPLNIPSWNSEQDKEQFTIILAKLQKMYKQLKV